VSQAKVIKLWGLSAQQPEPNAKLMPPANAGAAQTAKTAVARKTQRIVAST
jgi:hypothetical protein